VRKEDVGRGEVRGVGRSIEALEARIDAIARRTLALLRAGSAISEIIDEFAGHPRSSP